MSNTLIITGETGGNPPYQFFICDENGNNCQFIGTTGGTFTLNPLFQSAEILMVKVIDSNNFEYFKLISCPVGYLLQETGFYILQENGFKILL